MELRVADSSDGEVGFSLQDLARQDLLNSFWRVRRWGKVLTEENVKLNGFVKLKSALEALSDLYAFVDDTQIKQQLHYKREELKAFEKFSYFYFEPQLKILMEYKKKNQDKVPVGQNGFSLFHFRRWKLLCRLLVEVSGVTKFERKKELSDDLAFAAGAG